MFTRHTPRSTNGAHRRRSAGIWALTLFMGVGSLVWWVGLLRGLPAPRAPHEIAWPILAALFGLAATFTIRFDRHKASFSLELSYAVLLPAVAFQAPSWVFVAAVVGSAVYALYRRHGVMKMAFGISTSALAVACGLTGYHDMLGNAAVATSRGWFAATVALVVAEVVQYTGVMLAVSVSEGNWTSLTSKFPWQMFLLEVTLDGTLGLIAIRAYSADQVGGILLLALAVVVAAQYVVHGRLRLRHARLRQLYEFERSLASMVESDQVIAAVLDEALRLLHAEVAELVLAGRSVGTDGVTYTLRAGETNPSSRQGAHPLVERLGEGDTALLAPAGTDDPGLAAALEACGFRDGLAISLEAEEGAADAYLVVADHEGGQPITFTQRDLPLAETLTAPAAMALRSSELLRKLRAEIASKEHEATHDPLTGLANRSLINRELEQALAHRSSGALVGVMVVDMDDFKGVNDGFGHETGDAFLQAVASRMRATVGGRGHVGRLGGDEFAVVVPYARRPAEIATLAADLDIAVRAPSDIGGANVERRASIGVSIAPQHGNDRSTLLRAADLSMYLAKQHGGGVVVYSHARDGELDRPSLLAGLREAIASSTLDLCYQPKVALDTGKVVGVEALLRWTHPVLGPISPDRFIPEAESSGLIRPLTRWVLATAIAQCSIWHQEGLDLHVAVNLSPTQMDDDEVVTQVRQLLDAHNLPASSLVLEITESGAVEERPADPTHVLEPLARLGVQLSIDDFGVGTSSLSRIKHLPVTEIKIDKSFITELSPESVDGAIVASTIELAHQLGLSVVAEGVENDVTFRQLAALGCDVAQGYLMSVPLRPDDLGAWLNGATEASSGGHHWGAPGVRRLATS